MIVARGSTEDEKTELLMLGLSHKNIERLLAGKPMKQKVVSVASRAPINRQAALIVARPPWWAKLEFDVPDRPPPTVTIEELRAAHQENAALAKTIEALRSANRQLLEDITKLRTKLLQEQYVRKKIEQTVKEIL